MYRYMHYNKEIEGVMACTVQCMCECVIVQNAVGNWHIITDSCIDNSDNRQTLLR